MYLCNAIIFMGILGHDGGNGIKVPKFARIITVLDASSLRGKNPNRSQLLGSLEPSEKQGVSRAANVSVHLLSL